MRLSAALFALFLAGSAAADGGTSLRQKLNITRGFLPVELDQQGIISFTGGYWSSRTDFRARIWRDFYEISGRFTSFHFSDAFAGTAETYYLWIKRQLYHVSVKGGAATRPPNIEGASFHLYQGEMKLTFYGLILGPETPALSEQVWESQGPLPPPDSLDRTWVSALTGRLTGSNYRIVSGGNAFRLVQNATQLEFTETWRERTSLFVQFTLNRYNQNVNADTPIIFLQNIDYIGQGFPLRGWPNNQVGAQISQELGENASLSGGVSHIDRLDNVALVVYSVEGKLRLWRGLSAGTQYYYSRRRQFATREALGLKLSYAW